MNIYSFIFGLLAINLAFPVFLDNDCPQNKVVKGWYCTEEEEIYINAGDVDKQDDGTVLCKSCREADVKHELAEVRVCEKSFWQAADCEEDPEEVSLSPGKCCGGKGEPMVEVKDHALLVDKCKVCGAFAIKSNELKHNEHAHGYWKCQSCGMKMNEGEECCGKPTIKARRGDELVKGVCSKSGEFPHVAKMEDEDEEESEDEDGEDH